MMNALNPKQLLSLIVECSWGVPVGYMESLLCLGSEAATEITRFLMDRDLGSPDELDLLWPIVALGELRDPRGIPPLIKVIRESPGLELPEAASEALAKIGAESLATIMEAIHETPGARSRVFCYAVLSRLRMPQAWRLLEEAIEEDKELDFAAARGLADRSLPEDQIRIHRLYQRTDPWKRMALEQTLLGMVTGRLPWRPEHEDWRLRYRRDLRAGLRIPVGWPSVLYLIWESRDELRPEEAYALLSLEEFRQKGALLDLENRCPDCGEIFRSPTGIPLCREVEEDLISFQIQKVGDWLADKWTDIHEVLDQLDYQEVDVLQWQEQTDEERAKKGEALDTIDAVRNTLSWMVTEGINDLAQGMKRLEAALASAKTRGK